jgi:hypothetical protein
MSNHKLHEDIIKIHNQGIRYYQNLKDDIDTVKRDIELLKQTCETYTFNVDQRVKLKQYIEMLETHLENIINDNYINFFNLDTIEILDMYKTIITTPVNHSFMTNSTDADNDYTYTIKRNVVTEFLKIIEYFKIDITNDVIQNSDSDDNSSEGINNNSTTTNPNYNKHKYDRMNHFKHNLNKFQGKQPSIPNKIMESIEETIKTHGITNVTKGHLRLFLKDMKLSKYYEDINYMYCYYNNCFEDYNISHMEQKLIDDFAELLQVYDTMELTNGFKRKNFISTQYVLYHLMKKNGIECDINDFNIIKTIDRLRVHDEIMKIIFDVLGWSFG